MVWAVVIVAKATDKRKAEGLVKRVQAWGDKHESYTLIHELRIDAEEFKQLRDDVNTAVLNHVKRQGVA